MEQQVRDKQLVKTKVRRHKNIDVRQPRKGVPGIDKDIGDLDK